MIYFDCDGTLIDTEGLLFEEWRKNPDRDKLPSGAKIEYIRNADWEKILYEAPILGNSIDLLKEIDPNTSAILTKIHSRDNEGKWKAIYFRDKGVKQRIIFVPYYYKKTEIVLAKGNVLVDDCLKNNREWSLEGGNSYFFDIDGNNIDRWGEYNEQGFTRVHSIERFINYKG